METLYLAHFGLNRQPFNVTPDPSFLYLSASHQEALAQLEYGVKARKGFVVLTGEVGTGKTTLVHALLEELKRTHTKSAWVFKMILSPRDLLHYICEDFGISGLSDCTEVPEYLTLLNQFLLESYRAGANVALIIDEAQNLSRVALESVRLLSNFETPQDKLLQIILVGQPELATRLNSPELRQLKQRLVLRHHLNPLSFAESVEYISSRLKIAGGSCSIFTSQSLKTIYDYSGGTPRLINILCDNGMLTAYALRSEIVDATMIRRVAEDLSLTAPWDCFFPVQAHGDERKNKETSPAASKHEIDLTDVDSTKSNGKESFGNVGTSSESAMGGDLKSANRTLHLKGPETEPPTASDSESGTVPPQFFERMIYALTEAMGPMAFTVVVERVAAIGESLSTFPKQRLVQLVDETSREILSDTLRARFRQQMSSEIDSIDPR